MSTFILRLAALRVAANDNDNGFWASRRFPKRPALAPLDERELRELELLTTAGSRVLDALDALLADNT